MGPREWNVFVEWQFLYGREKGIVLRGIGCSVCYVCMLIICAVCVNWFNLMLMLCKC